MTNSFNKGFTLLEVMVACLLLGMLVTALTMVFTQSSIAWRTGMAGVVDLYDKRKDLGEKHDNYDNILPGLEEKEKDPKAKRSLEYRAVSLWENGELRADRAFARAKSVNDSEVEKGLAGLHASSNNRNVRLYTVGVRSAGPDGRFDTADDISTYPEDL